MNTAAAIVAETRRPIARRQAARVPWGRLLHYGWCSLSYLFLLSPLVVVIGASFNAGGEYAPIRFPPEHFSLEQYFNIPQRRFESMALSLGLATLAACIACLVGVPAALGLVRGNLPGKSVIAVIFRAPLQIPSIVTGIAFLQLFYIIGDATGVYWNGTFAGLVTGHAFVATPYVVGSVTAILQRFDYRLEEAALSLGATRWRTFRRVTLPVIMPGVYAGALYAFMVSFGDVPVSIFLSAPGTLTYPVQLFFDLENDFSPTILASASVVIVFCLVMLLMVQKVVGLEALLRSSGGGRR